MIKTFLKDKYNLAFITVLVVGIYIRLRYLFIESIWHDEAVYMWQASKLLNMNYLGTRIIEPPVLIVIAFNKLFTTPFIAGRLSGLYFGIAGIILIYFLGSEIKDRFVGLTAAMLLTFHHVFWFVGEKAILDVPLTTMFILTAYVLVKLEKSETQPLNFRNLYALICNNFWPMLLSFVLIATILTKRPGILAFCFVLVYFILTRRMKIFTDRKVIFSLGIPLAFLSIGSVVYYLIFKDFMLKRFFIYLFSVRSISEPFNFVRALPTVFGWYILPIFIFGVVLSVIYRKKSDILLLSWFWVYFVFFSVSIGGALPRYFLPIVPAAFLLTALALSEIRLYLKTLTGINLKKWIFLIIVLLLCMPYYQQGVSFNVNKSYSYTGFKEAGEWLAQNVEDDAFIYAGSPAAIRLFSGFEYINEGYAIKYGDPNAIMYYGFPKTQEEFEQQLPTRQEPVYLEVDVWEYRNQWWVYPLSQEKFDYFHSLGFELVKIVEQDVQTDQGLQRVQVIFIFKKI